MSHQDSTLRYLLAYGCKGRSEMEASNLKEAIARLEAEKEAGLAQFYKILKKLSCLESRAVSAEEESRRLKERAESYDLIADEKLSLEFEKAVLISLLEGLVYDVRNDVEAQNMSRSSSDLRQKNHVLTEELITVKTANQELCHQVDDGRDLVVERESQLQEAEQNLEAAERENLVLKSSIEALRRDYSEVQKTQDELENCRRLIEEEKKRKMLERLEGDERKLISLRLTVEDLKKKLEKMKEKDKQREYESVKEEIEEAEEGIRKLSEMNAKLKNGGLVFSPSEFEQSWIDTEVQKLQFWLLKLDREEHKPETRKIISSPKFVLREYIGKLMPRRRRKNHGRRKSSCSCIQSPTKEDY